KLMNNAPLQRGAGRRVISPRKEGVFLEVREARRTRILVCLNPEVAAIETPKDCSVTLAQPDRARENGFEHCPQIERGAANDAQDLARSCLLFQSLRKALLERSIGGGGGGP